jgi:hypothetical protein
MIMAPDAPEHRNLFILSAFFAAREALMRKFIPVISALMLLCYSLLAVNCASIYAEYTGGSGDGWSQRQVNPTMFRGGSGDGSHVAYSIDTAVGYGSPAKCSFSTQPSGAYAGVAFATQPVVNILDAFDNRVLTATNTVSMSITNDPPAPPASSLGGTVSKAAVSGVADFSGLGLSINRAGTGFTISAQSSGLTSRTSSAFNIISPVRVASPNGGEVWTIGTDYDIAWDTYGSLVTGQNTVEYSTNNGLNWSSLSANASSPLSWVTPVAPALQCLVRVSNSADATFTDISDGTFKLTGGLNIVLPNGGETWAGGFAHSIQWQTTGTISNVKLEYYDGLGWNTIMPSIANTNGYSWAPDVSLGGTGYKIRVSDALDPDVKGESAASFTVQKIELTAPTVGQRKPAGSSTNITWNSSGVSNMKIEYSVNNGAWTSVTDSTPAAAGTFPWNTPSNFTASVNVKLRLSSTTIDSDGNTMVLISDAFTVYGQLTLTAPAGGEQWTANTEHNVTWNTSAGTIANVKLEYSTDNFFSDIHTIINSTPNTGTYGWTPSTTGTTFKVRVSDAQDSQTNSVSGDYFSLTGIGISAPASGETWSCGTHQNITWTYTGSFTNVKIEYYDGSGWNTIANSALNSGSYDWPVENTPTTAAQVRISDAVDGDPTATSQPFNIKSVIDVTAPDGGEALIAGSTGVITWSVTGSVSNVKIEYSTDNGISYSNVNESEGAVNDGIVVNDGSFTWNVPADAICSQALIRISDADADHPASSNTSVAPFTINSGIVITSPSGNPNWAVGEPHNITWTNTGTVGQVRIYYATSEDNYSTWTEITSGAVANNNTHSWTITDIILAVGHNPQTNPTLPVKIKIVDVTSGHPATEAISGVFNVIYYTITFTVRDSQTGSDMSSLSVTCTSGWSATGLTSGINTFHNYPYGTYTTIWSRAEYTDSSFSGWIADSSKPLDTTMALASIAGQEHRVYSNFTYDAGTDSYIINAWLEKSGVIVTGPTSCTVSIEDKDGNSVDINGISPGNDITSSSPNANGAFRLSWDLTNINRNTSYFGKVQIVNSGTTYSGNVIYAIAVPSAQVATLGANLTSHRTATEGVISAIQTSIGAGLGSKVDTISSKADTLQTDMNSVKAAVGVTEAATLSSRVDDILANSGVNIPATIANELKKGPRSKILNRPTSVNTGDKVTIRYQTDSGKSPLLVVYDDSNVARVPGAVMTEIGATGVYEYEVTFDTAWGTGDYTIFCSETDTASADSMIISVGTGVGLIGIEAKVNSIVTSLSSVSANVTNIKSAVGTTSDAAGANTLYGKLAGMSTTVGDLNTKWGVYDAADIIRYVDTLELNLGTPNDAVGRQTVFGKIADIYAQTGTVPGVSVVANGAYNEIQQLREEVNLKGKTDTAYSLLDNINSAVGEIRSSIDVIPAETTGANVEKIAASVKETKEALKKVALEAGIKGAVKDQGKRVPATLDNLQNQVSELKALMVAVKAMLKEKEGPVVKTWFEAGAPEGQQGEIKK